MPNVLEGSKNVGKFRKITYHWLSDGTDPSVELSMSRMLREAQYELIQGESEYRSTAWARVKARFARCQQYLGKF